MPVVGVLGQGTKNNGLVVRRQGTDVRRRLHVLEDQLPDICPSERSVAGEQLLKDDGQAVLIAESADITLEGLRCSVNRRNAARQRRDHPFQVFDQTEVGNLDVIVDQEKVLRLDVEM